MTSKSSYEEAIEILVNMGTEFISVPCNPIGEENSDMIHLRDVTETYEANMNEVVKALKQAQKQEKLLEQLVERDTPMTPIYESIELICPKCREGQHTNTAKFCSECGQRLDWKELENERN